MPPQLEPRRREASPRGKQAAEASADWPSPGSSRAILCNRSASSGQDRCDAQALVLSFVYVESFGELPFSSNC